MRFIVCSSIKIEWKKNQNETFCSEGNKIRSHAKVYEDIVLWWIPHFDACSMHNRTPSKCVSLYWIWLVYMNNSMAQVLLFFSLPAYPLPTRTFTARDWRGRSDSEHNIAIECASVYVCRLVWMQTNKQTFNEKCFQATFISLHIENVCVCGSVDRFRHRYLLPFF